MRERMKRTCSCESQYFSLSAKKDCENERNETDGKRTGMKNDGGNKL